MAFAAQIISSSDYGSIRIALGLADSDTAVSDNLIEDLLFLPAVELVIRERLDDWADIVDEAAPYDADRHDRLKRAAILGTAARIASVWFARRATEEIKAEKVGPVAVTFRDGPEWAETAEKLACDAATELSKVETWGVGMTEIGLVSRGGPTRDAKASGTVLSVSAWQDMLWPDAVKGHV